MKAEYPAHLQNLHAMLSFVHQQSIGCSFNESGLHEIALACEEALVNIINHGYKTKKGTVIIECRPADKKGIEIILSDHGIPFNPLEHIVPPSKDTRIESRRLGGNGIHMMVKLIDKVEYRREQDINILTLVKYKPN